MTTITVTASRTYEVLVGGGILADVGKHLSALLKPPATVLLVSDKNVYPHYGKAVTAALKGAGYTVIKHIIPVGEESKSGRNLQRLWQKMAANAMTRSDCVVALGGGVVGDLAGFAAATYLRGIAYYQLPTSLLAMVDSSIGGKTAINLPAGKNLCGAFWQPLGVLCDTAVLSTLPEKYFRDGMAEVIKYGYIGNPDLLNLLAEESDGKMEEIIARCVKDKRDIVEADERENGQRRLLNLGHTAGHAIEKLSAHAISHGHAVAIGMLLAAKGAVALSLCDKTVPTHMEKMLTRYGLDTKCSYTADELARIAALDKKRTGDTITLVIPTEVGKSVAYAIPVDGLSAFFKKGGAPL